MEKKDNAVVIGSADDLEIKVLLALIESLSFYAYHVEKPRQIDQYSSKISGLTILAVLLHPFHAQKQAYKHLDLLKLSQGTELMYTVSIPHKEVNLYDLIKVQRFLLKLKNQY